MPFFFMTAVLRAVAQGGFFRFVFATFLRIIAVLCLIGFLMAGAGLLTAVGSVGGAVLLGGVLFFIFILIGAYMVVHSILLRAADIIRLPESDFTVISIISLFLKLFGEVMACCYATIGVGGGLLLLCAGPSVPYSLRSSIPLVGSLPFVESGGFLGAIILLLSSALIGFVGLTFFYLLSEAVIVLVDIAHNLRLMRQAMTGFAIGPGSLPAAPGNPPGGPMTQVVAAPQGARCYQCGNALLPGSAFCERCGARVA